MADFLARPPRQDLEEYNFAIIRDAPPGLSAVIALILLLNAIPVVLAARSGRLDFRQSGAFPAVALLNILVIMASLTGLGEAQTLVYFVLVPFAFAVATGMSACASGARDLVGGLLSGIAVGIGVTLLVMIRDGNFSYGRLMGRSGPNYWGMNAVAVFFASLALRSVPLKAVTMGVALGAIYLCQSRGAMVALAIGSGVVWLALFWHAARYRLLLIGLPLAVGIVGLLLFNDFIAAKLLLLDNKDRGVESGGTGRFAAWLQAIDLFLNQPILGVGYRQHEKYITAASSAHNAYLAVLAEMGLFGIVAYLLLMLGGAILATRKAFRRFDRVHLAAAGLTWGFLIVGMIERVGLTTGNALSLTMLYVTAWSYRREPSGMPAGKAAMPSVPRPEALQAGANSGPT